MSSYRSDTIKRVGSAALLLPIYIWTIITDSYNSLPILGISIIVSLLTLYEFYRITDNAYEGKSFLKTGLLSGAALNVAVYLYTFGDAYGFDIFMHGRDAKFILCVITVIMVTVFALQIFTRPLKGAIHSVAVTIFGVVFIPFFFSHMILLKAVSNGIYYIILLNVVVMVNDTGAYFGGMSFGKHKTKFPASPNKSWEGYFFGLVSSIAATIAATLIFDYGFGKNLFSIFEAVILGIILSIGGNLGDLIESAVKRDGGVKDSGKLLPGHGGMWDAFDAVIFTMPVFYYYIIYRGL